MQNMPGCQLRKYGWGKWADWRNNTFVLTALISFGRFNIHLWQSSTSAYFDDPCMFSFNSPTKLTAISYKFVCLGKPVERERGVSLESRLMS